MRSALLLAIRGYWRLVPAQRRRACLFATSCSRHVYETTQHAGLAAGLSALTERIRTCRPGYGMLRAADTDGAALLRLANGKVVRLETMAARVQRQFTRAGPPGGGRALQDFHASHAAGEGGDVLVNARSSLAEKTRRSGAGGADDAAERRVSDLFALDGLTKSGRANR